MKSTKPYRPDEEIEIEDHNNNNEPGFRQQTRRHRSWGFLQLTTASGGSGDMFLSDTQHQHRVRLVVGSAKMITSGQGERTHIPNGVPFVEVEVTEADLGRLISRNSQYAGVPCTVIRVGNESMPECPPSTRFEEFAYEVKTETDNVTAPLRDLDKVLRRLEALVNKTGTIKKGEIRQVVEDALEHSTKCYNTMTDKLPHYVDMLVEHMSKVVDDGKASINAHATLKAQELGIAPEVLQLREGEE